jgi:hypothetical protein
MRLQPIRTSRARAAFSLVELILVIGIIALLTSLVVGAVMAVMGRLPDIRAREELGEFEMDLGRLKSDLNGVSYLPSRLKLHELNDYNMNDPDDVATVAWLEAAFGKRILDQQWIDWNGDNQQTPGGIFLEGQYVLVFLLGGIPSAPGQPAGCLGFSTDRTNPASNTTARLGPYFPFKGTRLIRNPTTNFCYYLDPYYNVNPNPQPYLYFSSWQNSNYSNDCPSFGVAPYYDSATNKFINPTGFQIISAGRDQKFGAGGAWPASNGYPATDPGADDMANFSKLPLGKPQD